MDSKSIVGLLSPKAPQFSTMNRRGLWVPAIPEPYYGARKVCRCGSKFWTLEGYRGHYSLVHILSL